MTSEIDTPLQNENAYLVDEEKSDDEASYESDSEYETNSEEEEETQAEEEGDDDGLALLMQARRRMQEQKEKEKMAEEHNSEESEKESDDEDLEREVEGVKGLDLTEEIGDSSQMSLPESLSLKIPDDSPVQAQWLSPSRGLNKEKSTEGLLPAAENDDSNMTALRRKQRDENSELWELLRHSQNRVAETKDLVEKIEKAEMSDSEGESDSDEELHAETTTGSTPAKSDAVDLIDSDAKKDDSKFQIEDEKKSEEDEVERDFEQENRELFELLQQSKRRLEEAARKKIEEAEKEAAADDQKAEVKENPYKDLHNLPDNPEDKGDDEDLTQKELLIAMAVAEEAARSGRGDFVTPSKEVLRSRDLASFDFLKEEDTSVNPSAAQTPEDITMEEEKSRIRSLYNTLSTRWSTFKERAKQIDREQQYINAKRRAAMINKSRLMMMSGIRKQLTG